MLRLDSAKDHNINAAQERTCSAARRYLIHMRHASVTDAQRKHEPPEGKSHKKLFLNEFFHSLKNEQVSKNLYRRLT